MHTGLRLALLLAALVGCTRERPTGPARTPLRDFTGVWAGDAGPNLAALRFGAKIEIQDDAGAISGEFFNEDPEKPGVYLPTGQIRGTRDGGTLFLVTGREADLGDAGKIYPQFLLLNYDGERLTGFRRLQLPGRPVVDEYLILRK